MPEEDHAQAQPSDHPVHHKVHVHQHHVQGIRVVRHKPDLLRDQAVVVLGHRLPGRVL
ncbi:MAG: hypothetical protein K0U82_16405 [Planctomycetes bacterium]|nr:hypothetical protein [Planctomycetota bacterium]